MALASAIGLQWSETTGERGSSAVASEAFDNSANNETTMAKTSKSTTKTPLPKWKTKWPRNADRRSWLICMIEKCDAIAEPYRSSSEAELPIEILAELGHPEEALKYVDRFLRKPAKDKLGNNTVGMARLGAQICLDNGDLERMEKYLARVESEPVRRKCDLGWPARAVQKFRAHNGLLDPNDAVDEEQRIEATFQRGKRRFNEAQSNQQLKQATAALAEMEKAAATLTEESFDYDYCNRTIAECYAALGDMKALNRRIKKFDKEAGKQVLDYRTLWKLGKKTDAIKRATGDVKNRLQELAEMDDPNIHFPVTFICLALEFLVEHDQQKLAKDLLGKVLEEVGAWPVIERGWMTAAVYTMLAEIVAKVMGPAAAKALIAKAEQDSKAERRPGWRKGAVAGVMDLKANQEALDESIAQARKMRSPTERRRRLASLLLRAKRWNELSEVCSGVPTPEEAADLCGRIHFELKSAQPS